MQTDLYMTLPAADFVLPAMVTAVNMAVATNTGAASMPMTDTLAPHMRMVPRPRSRRCGGCRNIRFYALPQ